MTGAYSQALSLRLWGRGARRGWGEGGDYVCSWDRKQEHHFAVSYQLDRSISLLDRSDSASHLVLQWNLCVWLLLLPQFRATARWNERRLLRMAGQVC